jgi:hypothetical protein
VIERQRKIAAPGRSATTVRGRVLAVDDRCWRCRSRLRAVAGVLVAADGAERFVALEEIDGLLATLLDQRALAARRIGPLRHRDSPGVLGGYISNGCPECDALIGRFRVDDLLAEHRAQGKTLRQLDIGIEVRLPGVVTWSRAGATGR